jgi:hypothetical protein
MAFVEHKLAIAHMYSSVEFANLGQSVGRPDYRRDALLAYWPSPTTMPKQQL